jgi:hypothetical protein
MTYRLSRLKKNGVFMKHIRFDVTPEVIFKPRFIRDRNNRDVVEEIRGFMFYIDHMDETTSLMLMKTYNLTSKTMGDIEKVPRELLLNAVNREGIKDIVGMYPIDDKLENWIKGKLDLL